MTKINTHTRDVEAGCMRAYIVQPRKERHKPSRRVRRMLARKKGLAAIGSGLLVALKGVYAASILYAMVVAASLLEAGNMDTVNIARTVVAIIWVAVPAAVKIGGARR